MDFDSKNTLLALEKGAAASSLIPDQAGLPIINVDDLLSTEVTPAGIGEQADLLNPNTTEPAASRLPTVGGIPKSYTDRKEAGVDAEQVVTLPNAAIPEEQIPDHAVLPDIDLAETIISNDQNSALIDSGAVVHKVQPGETLEDISQRYDISAQEIIRANDLEDPDAISSVTALRIPAHQSLSLALNSSTASSLNVSEQETLGQAQPIEPGPVASISKTVEPDQAQSEELINQSSLNQNLGSQPLAPVTFPAASEVQALQPI
ncbi:MAG: LysM peptidoglycan-binding domain-containing protein [Acaryochloridaceae cyanobacterium CSU_5_19]|nr:LysM peptidoglycan-binding domain-containing protein [Acaryochloridaceae cyanobacterium CSU_5_19]